jgi:ABC-2 type transport system permease protein
MTKYLRAYGIALQETLQRRSTLLMDRIGGFAVVLSLYSFWNVLLGTKTSFLGYTRPEMLTYVLIISVLRSFVFTGRGWLLVGEISSGRISSYLVRPLSYHGYAFLEIGLLVFIARGGVFVPRDPAAWALFAAAALIASLIFFFLEFAVSTLAFWTSESGGPLFCFELFLQFAAGAFFPLDVLPESLRRLLSATPFPYMVYFPARVLLQKIAPAEALRMLGVETAWLAAAAAVAYASWYRGLRVYAAEGG